MPLPYHVDRNDRKFMESEDAPDRHGVNDLVWYIMKTIVWTGLHWTIAALNANQFALSSASVSKTMLNSSLIISSVGAGVNVLASFFAFLPTLRNKRPFLSSYEFLTQLMYFIMYTFVSYSLWRCHAFVGVGAGMKISNDAWFTVNSIFTIGITIAALCNGFDQLARSVYSYVAPDGFNKLA